LNPHETTVSGDLSLPRAKTRVTVQRKRMRNPFTLPVAIELM